MQIATHTHLIIMFFSLHIMKISILKVDLYKNSVLVSHEKQQPKYNCHHSAYYHVYSDCLFDIFLGVYVIFLGVYTRTVFTWIYSKRCSTYQMFHAANVALIEGRRFFKGWDFSSKYSSLQKCQCLVIWVLRWLLVLIYNLFDIC